VLADGTNAIFENGTPLAVRATDYLSLASTRKGVRMTGVGPWLPIQNVRFSAASECKAEVLA